MRPFARHAHIAFVGTYENAVLRFQRHAVVVRIEKMLLKLDSELYASLQHLGLICRGQLQSAQHCNIAGRSSSALASEYCADFQDPVYGLQYRLLAIYHLLHQLRCFVCLRFAVRVLQQPFDDYTGVEDGDHDLPAVREGRIRASDNAGRSRRFCVRARKISMRRCRSFTSATALRIKSAMTALLFCPPKVRSNSALTSSGTLKLTVAIIRWNHC
jgi:hypothetical protein